MDGGSGEAETGDVQTEKQNEFLFCLIHHFGK